MVERSTNKKPKAVAKANLPQKICVVCELPFTWRKKWENCWDEVTTCSKKCNAQRKANKRPQKNHDEKIDTNQEAIVDHKQQTDQIDSD